MKLSKILAAAAFIAAFHLAPAQADTYKFDPNHTNVLFHISHFGFSNPSGHFGIVDGSMTIDEKVPAQTTVDITIDVNSLLTGVSKLDEHAKSSDFLDAGKFPTAVFKSTHVQLTGKDTANVTGDLTLHGVTKPITLSVKLNKLDISPIAQKKTAGFTASTILKRSDFGITKYVPSAPGGPGVGDEVKIDIDAEANITG